MVSTAEEALSHADAFAHETGDESAACADFPLEQRLEVLLLTADRPLAESRLIELLGLMPPPAAAPLKRKRSKAPPTTAAASDAGDAPEADPEPPADDAATVRHRKQAIAKLTDLIARLNAAYEATGRAFRIEAISAGYQVLTLPAFGPLLARLRGDRHQSKLSQAALETLAIIAYRQPILRADLESIRGVACGEVLKSLMDRRLVRIVGRAEEVGRPMLYGTTREFLRVFGLATTNELPQARELKS
ncbi:MAG: SMC-Scp complex subunit ScpB [Phycisphaerae bacterium]|nr:SMC-Scp complex subunit ScpB [Phycisphaerae bacterium]